MFLCVQPLAGLCSALMGLAALMVKPVCWTVRGVMVSWTAPTTAMRTTALVGPNTPIMAKCHQIIDCQIKFKAV